MEIYLPVLENKSNKFMFSSRIDFQTIQWKERSFAQGLLYRYNAAKQIAVKGKTFRDISVFVVGPQNLSF